MFTPTIPPKVEQSTKVMSLIKETALTGDALKANDINVIKKKKIKPPKAPTKKPFFLKSFALVNPSRNAPTAILVIDKTNISLSSKSRLVTAIAQTNINSNEDIIETNKPIISGFIKSYLEKLFSDKKITPKPFNKRYSGVKYFRTKNYSSPSVLLFFFSFLGLIVSFGSAEAFAVKFS